MGEFYSKRYFYKGGIGMTQSLKRFASAVLALVMAMTCLVFTNVASVSAAEGDTLVDVSSEVTFTLNKNLNNVGTSAVTGDYNGLYYDLSKADSSSWYITTGYIRFTPSADCTLTMTTANNKFNFSGGEYSLINQSAVTNKDYSLKANTEYTISANDKSKQVGVKVLKFTPATGDSTTTTEATTTTETTTETTTTTTTEATTEATTVANQTLYKYYVNAADATANSDSIDNNATTVFTNAKTSTNTLSGENTAAVGGKDYTLNYRSSNATTLSIVVPEGVENATLYVVARSSSSTGRALTLTKGTETVDDKQSTGGTTPVVATYTGLSTGTYTLTSDGNMQYSLLVLSVPTTVGTTTTTTETTTETTTTTTTEATTEATTTASVQVWTPDNKTNILGSAVSGLSTSKASGRTSAFVDSIFGDGETATGAINGQNYVLLNDENIIPTATGKLKLYVVANDNEAVTNGTIKTGDTAVYSGTFAARNNDTAVKAITIDVEAGKTYNVSNQVMLFRAELTPTGSTETSTETTTKATTTTETTTEETTMGVLKVMVNNPASSSDTTVNVTVKKNGTTISNVTALNIGSETEIAGVNEDDVITFTFAKEQAKQITNWNSNLKSVFRDKTYTLTYTVGKTIAIPEMDYYSSMPAAVSLGQTETKAAGYGTYGFGQYKVQTNGNDLAKCAIIKGHQYSLFDVGSGDYDKDGTEYGIPDERVLLLGGTDDEIELKNSIDSSEKVLVLLDCSGDNAIVTATNGNLYSSYDGSTGTTVAQITGISKNGVKVQFYVDGGTTITIKGTGTSANAYTVVKSIRLFNLNNIVDGDKKLDNGKVADMTETSPFYDVVTSNSLANDDMLFTLIGTVTGNHKDKDFLNQVDKVGFVILNADTVDTYDKDGTLTPMQLKYNNPGVNFGGVYVETTDIYKNVYDVTNYNSSLDNAEGYTGDVDSTLETNNNVAYFAELVSVSAGHRYYAYPYTLYAGATQRAYDTNPKGTRIEISNK